jgi:hypothetical protein
MTPSRHSTVVYPSKRDLWLELVLLIAVVAMVVGAVSVWKSPEELAVRVILLLVFLAAGGLTLWVTYGTRYVLTDEQLVARAGPFRWGIRLDAIQEVRPTRNPLSSPAVSLDRLSIRYGKVRRQLLVSPDDKQAFLRDLVARSHGLMKEGDRLVRVEESPEA